MAVVKTTYDFDQMLSNAREAYGEELLRKLNIEKIERDAVTLMPYLLKIRY